MYKRAVWYNQNTIVKNSPFIHEFHVLIEVFMLLLALLSGVLLLIVLFGDVSPALLSRIDNIDITIAVIFLFEFFVRLICANNKLSFIKTSWWELLAAIPVTNDLTQALRLLRLLRIGRLLLHLKLIKEKNGERVR